MSYIIKGQAVGIEPHYICVIQGIEYLTRNRVHAHRYDNLSHVLAAIPSLNLNKPFGRPDLTYSWESIHDDFGHTYVRDLEADDDEMVEAIGWPQANPGWSCILAVAVAGALALMYVAMMMNRPVG